MIHNVGGVDRILRVIVGLALLSLVFIGPKTLWGLVGLVPLGTAAVGFCPAYLPFGLKTCKKA
jgi:Na+/proline symporter